MTEVCVKVALRVRPLLPHELIQNHKVCVRIVPDSTQVMVGSDRLFSFDHAFGPTATQDEVYNSCVQPLVETLLRGDNATVFCFGQTGSGKTYTFGGGNLGEEGGIIDRVAENMFSLLGEKKNSDGVETTVRVTYLELYMEELQDLLESHNTDKELFIRENDKGNAVVVGAKEIVVTSAEELLSVVEAGNVLRHINTTGMNEHSSRSHTILTLQVVKGFPNNNPSFKSSCSSKLCLVDLAGSERAQKTGNRGSQLKESAHINRGLLALGNVIRALAYRSRNRNGNNGNSTHIPYRDAKITRLLQDSMGGTAHTVMVACVSPSHHSVAETVGVLQFAAKARHIRNCPIATSTHTDVKLCPTNWDPGEARRGELEYEVQTLRELLKEKEREIEMQRADGRAAEEESIKKSSQMRLSEQDHKMNPYRLLTQEAAALLTDISRQSFGQRLQDWQERLAVVANAHPINDEVRHSEGAGDQADHVRILKLRQDLQGCQGALNITKQLLEQKDAELRHAQNDVEKLLHESKTCLQDLEEEKERNRLQTEQLVDQQIVIDRLRGKKPHCVPPRMSHSSTQAYSLERVMASFKIRGHLLLAELEEKDEVRCPFIKQAESKDSVQEKQEEEEEEDDCVGKMAFRRYLNRTWTHSKMNRNPLVQQSQRVTGTEADLAKQSHVRKGGLRAGVTQRRIQDLSVTMVMGLELIKELDKTDKEIQAVERCVRQSQDGREAGILAKLSMHSRQVRSEVYRSLQHTSLQREQIQTSLGQQRQTADNNTEPGPSGTHRSSWLEQHEELVLQEQAELQELQEELRSREEVVQRRETCLQQKKHLEVKKLHTSKALSQNLLRVSVQLESVEENLRSSSNTRRTTGVTTEELEKERERLRKRKDALEAQLTENGGLTVTENHSLFQLEEAIEALDAALEFKNDFIRDIQKKLSITDSSSSQSQNTEPAQLCGVSRKLKQLSPPEALELLVKYFNKVVCLRETERHLLIRCKELELDADEQEWTMKKMKTTMQYLALDADRRLIQLHIDYQKNIQLLLQELQKDEAKQQALQDRLQHVENELFYYKSSCRQLKKNLKEHFSGGPNPDVQPSQKPEHHMPDDNHIQTHRCVASECEERFEMTPVRLNRRDLRQIFPADLQISGSATSRRQSAVETISEAVLGDSLEVARPADNTATF
ncbi:kinesin-like protein KIF27 [Hippoglossus stenolepis]|uniref:kinesin-like protein KIF27 n=1 Tax=Hippoglossus stenolepis TaxID=195615 RepID=UPI001FAE929C|nr:kinesin-like protein KIF27 [Hippoglossus stenolepis]